MGLQSDEQNALAKLAKTDSWIARNPGKTLLIGIALVVIIGLQLFKLIP
jgi:hypothetical protein